MHEEAKSVGVHSVPTIATAERVLYYGAASPGKIRAGDRPEEDCRLKSVLSAVEVRIVSMALKPTQQQNSRDVSGLEPATLAGLLLRGGRGGFGRL